MFCSRHITKYCSVCNYHFKWDLIFKFNYKFYLSMHRNIAITINKFIIIVGEKNDTNINDNLDTTTELLLYKNFIPIVLSDALHFF